MTEILLVSEIGPLMRLSIACLMIVEIRVLTRELNSVLNEGDSVLLRVPEKF